MTILITLLVVTLSWLTVVRPWAVARRRRNLREFHRTFRRFKSFAVMKYHPAFRELPELKRLSLDDVNRLFDVDRAYDDLRLIRSYPESFV